MELEILNQSSVRVPRSYIESCVNFLRKSLPKKHSSDLKKNLNIIFFDESQSRNLNKQFRGKDYATDVLSFEGMGEDLGELIICPQVIQKQAKEHGLSVRDEMAYMVIHGVLHLLGYDHETSETDAKKMFRLQDRIFDDFLAQ